MRSQERNGITVDRCSGCGGIFLDRGELERLVELEGRYDSDKRGMHSEDEEERYESGRPAQRRRRGLLGELFDLG